MDSLAGVYVNIPCPTQEEAISLSRELISMDLCGIVKIHDHVHLMYTDGKEVQGDDVVVMTLKTTQGNLQKIQEFITRNHSWGDPCIEVVPIILDMC